MDILLRKNDKSGLDLVTEPKGKKAKIARVSTVPFFIDTQLRVQLKELIDNGFDVTAIASDGNWDRLTQIDGLKSIVIPIARAPSIIQDMISVYKLVRCFKEHQFDIIHSTTPKAGLVCAIACKLAGMDRCLHTFTGQTWASKEGLSRLFLKLIDKLVLRLTTQCYADSSTQKQFLISEGVGTEESIKVLGLGSLAGVDMSRFNNDIWKQEKSDIKKLFGIVESDFVLTFIGRVNRDKGVGELLKAFQSLTDKYSNIHLLVVGPVEDKLLIPTDLTNIHLVGETQVPEKYMSITDVLCLPSYREGFGTVVIEAAAMKVPTLGTDIVGLRDAIKHGLTGILVEPRDPNAIRDGVEKLLLNRKVCQKLGEAAYQRCAEHFTSKKMTSLLSYEYEKYVTK